MPLALVPASTRRKIGILVLPWVAEHSAAGFGNRFESVPHCRHLVHCMWNPSAAARASREVSSSGGVAF